jgi:hypothetical protein
MRADVNQEEMVVREAKAWAGGCWPAKRGRRVQRRRRRRPKLTDRKLDTDRKSDFQREGFSGRSEGSCEGFGGEGGEGGVKRVRERVEGVRVAADQFAKWQCSPSTGPGPAAQCIPCCSLSRLSRPATLVPNSRYLALGCVVSICPLALRWRYRPSMDRFCALYSGWSSRAVLQLP